MGRAIDIKASDGHVLMAWRSDPAAAPKGAVVVLQEFFGVTGYIREVCDRFAALGYVGLAPALFDRVERGAELEYSHEGMKRGDALRAKVTVEQSLADVQAAIDYGKQFGKVAVVGFCWGGSLAFLAAARLKGPAAAVGYYGGWVAKYAEEKPRVPTLLHFGETDFTIPVADVEKVKQLRPDVTLYVYPAGHAFDCTSRKHFDPPSFHRESSELANKRTAEFLAKAISSSP
jgi:carboxymethylenebutenolidase